MTNALRAGVGLGVGHAACVLRGLGLSMPRASSPRALVAGILHAANAGGDNAGDEPYRGGTVFARKNKVSVPF